MGLGNSGALNRFPHRERAVCLRPGSYRVAAKTKDQRHGSVEIRVDGDSNAGDLIQITLR
jgi:hypothetical protein